MDTDIQKFYTCECGKVFQNSQSFNGHKSHCKIHIIATKGEQGYKQYIATQQANSKLAITATKKKAQAKKDLAISTWIAEQHICERCGKVMTEKFGSGRFCSRACANARDHSDETKNKISQSSLGRPSPFKGVSTGGEKLEACFCSICNAHIEYINKTGLCRYCLEHTDEGKQIKQQLGKKGYQTMLENGTHKPWQSRAITSYAEDFWITVLQNNDITFIREVPVKHGNSNYFLDFKIEKNGKLIDLEIDGKQHTYAERALSDVLRDLFLTKQGYLVYRVAWNEVVSDQGKLEMKNKIDEFLAFYNTL